MSVSLKNLSNTSKLLYDNERLQLRKLFNGRPNKENQNIDGVCRLIICVNVPFSYLSMSLHE